MTATDGFNATTLCHGKNPICLNYVISDIQLLECGNEENRSDYEDKATRLFYDAKCTMPARLDTCSSDDCNSVVTVMTCNVG